MKREPLIVITGPTACGKTPTAVALAKMIDGEIVSADAMQIYRGMDIGTAKPTMAERDGVPHHLLDVADPAEDFSAAIFKRLARVAVDDIHSRGKVPILAGGTGFYINAAVYDDALTPEETEAEDTALRKALMKQPNLHNRLKAADPISAERIHPNNTKRAARALAYYMTTGRPISSHNPKRELRYNTSFIILHRDRAQLYETIDNRVEAMISQGLANEVKNLLAAGIDENTTAMQALGYKEMVPYIHGLCTIEEAKTAIQQGSRRYAKRQLTWFRHQMNGRWLSMDDITPPEAARRIYNDEELSRHST